MKHLIKNLKLSWEYAKEEKNKIILFMICNIIVIALRIAFPIVSAKLIISLTNNELERLLYFGLIIFLLDIFNDLGRYIINNLAIKIYQNTFDRLGYELGKNILKLENECLDKNGSGVFITRLTNDTANICQVFNILLSQISDVIRYIGILIAILVISKIVFIFVFIFLIIIYFLERKRTKVKNELDKTSRKSKERLSGFTGELVRGARDIKMLSSERDFLKEYQSRILDYNSKKYVMEKTSNNYKIIIWWIFDIFFFLLIVFLIILIKRKVLIPTIALVIYNYVSSVTGVSFIIGSVLESIKDFNLSSDRLFSIINDDKQFPKEKFGKRHISKVEGNFEFKNVYFNYGEKEVLKDLSFKINANETVAFVGKSGGGKSTIFSLLCKMYNVDKGDITIDDININDLDKDSIRNNITIISQNPYIFNLTIKENLKLVKSNLTDKEMKEACRLACLDEFIESLPDGYNTIVGEGGVNLSGGQKQRLAIARALVQKTEIILLDEATSALDNETQGKISQAINNMKNEYTILIIAHRLSTIKDASRILYLENGHIIAEGDHNHLLDTCPEYQKLYETEIDK